MSFLSNILDSVKAKSAEMKDRKQFLDMVEADAKPIRRRAYYNQMLKEVVSEGIEKAKTDAAKKNVQQQKKKEDFGIGRGLEDPYKFLSMKSKFKGTNKEC